MEAEELLLLDENRAMLIAHYPHPIIGKLVEVIQKDFNAPLHKESYYRLSKTPTNGHPWHVDTGDRGQMPWCKVGASLLLNECGGGETYYKIENETKQLKRNKHDLVAHTSNVLHKVSPPNGKRLTLLLFI